MAEEGRGPRRYVGRGPAPARAREEGGRRRLQFKAATRASHHHLKSVRQATRAGEFCQAYPQEHALPSFRKAARARGSAYFACGRRENKAVQ